MKVNFFGVIDCVKAVEEYFKNKKSGHISIVSSIAGYRGVYLTQVDMVHLKLH